MVVHSSKRLIQFLTFQCNHHYKKNVIKLLQGFPGFFATQWPNWCSNKSRSVWGARSSLKAASDEKQVFDLITMFMWSFSMSQNKFRPPGSAACGLSRCNVSYTTRSRSGLNSLYLLVCRCCCVCIRARGRCMFDARGTQGRCIVCVLIGLQISAGTSNCTSFHYKRGHSSQRVALLSVPVCLCGWTAGDVSARIRMVCVCVCLCLCASEKCVVTQRGCV